MDTPPGYYLAATLPDGASLYHSLDPNSIACIILTDTPEPIYDTGYVGIPLSSEVFTFVSDNDEATPRTTGTSAFHK